MVVITGRRDWSSLGRLVEMALLRDEAAFWRAWEADMVGRRSGQVQVYEYRQEEV